MDMGDGGGDFLSQTPSQPKGIGDKAEITWQLHAVGVQPNPLTAERHWRRRAQRSIQNCYRNQPNPLTAERHWRRELALPAPVNEVGSQTPSQPKGIGDTTTSASNSSFEAPSAKPPHSRKALETHQSSRRYSMAKRPAKPPHSRKALETRRAVIALRKAVMASQTPSQPKGIGDLQSRD